MQVDSGQSGLFAESVESPGDRVGVWGRAVLPAEQQPVVGIVRAELGALPVERLDMELEGGQGERVEREGSLRVLGLAVRFDDLAVHDNACDVDREGSGAGIEP